MKMPQFAATTGKDKILAAIESGVLTYPSYTLDRESKKLYFLDSDDTLFAIIGDNKELVQRVDTLPTGDAVDPNVIYIKDSELYVANEEGVVIPAYDAIAKDLGNVKQELETAKETLSEVAQKVDELQKTESVQFVAKGELPETGMENRLYVTKDEPGVYVWNAEKTAYESPVSGASGLQWLEI